MGTGEILYCVLLGFILIWAADVFHVWAAYDRWREQRRERRERGG
jgi:hypothetical protein